MMFTLSWDKQQELNPRGADERYEAHNRAIEYDFTEVTVNG